MMRTLRLLWILIILLVSSGLPQNTFADKRSYVWTYEYMTMPKGAREIEGYVTAKIPDTSKPELNTIQPQVELEYGITDRWDVAVYQLWQFKNKSAEHDSAYDGFKLRTRYKVGEKGKYLVDPLVYLEYIRDNDLGKPNGIEAKLVVAKDIGNFNISYNQIVERDLEARGKSEHGYAAGIRYAFSPTLSFGIETKGNYSGEQYAIGPTVAFSTKKFWVALGTVFGLNQKTDGLTGRVIVGVPF